VNNNFDGVLIGSPGNTVEGNTISGSAGSGANGVGIAINATGAATIVKGNTVLGSSAVDLSDTNAACGSDIWRDNIFQISQAGPVLNPSCVR
jgi:parallel beta-helix repeat protein